jgi:hypothetical protein
MNTRFFHTSFVAVALAVVATSFAQAETPANALKRCISESYQLFHSGANDDVAEAKLIGLSPATMGSGDWHFSLALNLIRVVVTAQEANDPTAADRVAKRALIHLDQAQPAFAADKERLSSLYALRGDIWDRYLADAVSAVFNYSEAVRLNPDNESAAECLRRCKATLPSVQIYPAVTPSAPTTTETTSVDITIQEPANSGTTTDGATVSNTTTSGTTSSTTNSSSSN